MKNILSLVVNKITFVFYFLAFYSVVAQEQFIPSKGKIVFEQKQKIIDKELYDSTLIKFNTLFEKSLKQYIISENSNVDEAMLNILVSQSSLPINNPFTVNYDLISYQHNFEDSIIVVTKKVNNRILGDYVFLNRNSSTYDIKTKIDSSWTPIKNKLHTYKEEKGIIIKEYRNITKVINDFLCYRVILTINNEDDEFISGLENNKIIYELYVTEKIKCNYHPIINYESIVKKYYPLEIIEYNSIVKGVEKRFTLKEFTLN